MLKKIGAAAVAALVVLALPAAVSAYGAGRSGRSSGTGAGLRRLSGSESDVGSSSLMRER